MIKIGFVVNTIINAGPVNVLYDIVANINRTKFTPIILALKNNVEYRSRVKDFENLGIKSVFFNFSFLQMELRTKKCAKILDEFIEKNDIQILHLHGYHPVIIAAKLKSNITKITTLHNLCYEDYVQKKGKVIGIYMGKRFCQCLDYMDYCISITDYVRDYYHKCTKATNIHTIYNGVDEKRFIPCSPEEKLAIRREYNFSSNNIIFVICNSLIKRKNTIAFIEAANKVKDSNKKFLVLGDGVEMEMLKNASKNNSNIIFLGNQKNVVPFLQMADFFVSTSKSEGFGLAPIEAILCNIPIIYSDIPVYRELFYSREGLQPYMFNLESPDDLYQKIKNSTTIENIKEIAEYYREKFTARKMAKDYETLFTNIINNRE